MYGPSNGTVANDFDYFPKFRPKEVIWPWLRLYFGDYLSIRRL